MRARRGYGGGGYARLRHRLASVRDPFTYYGEHVETGEPIYPEGAINPVDDVTGEPIPPRFIGFQDGLVKDIRAEKGSFENEGRDAPLNMHTYDGVVYGVQQLPAGMGREEYPDGPHNYGL